MRIPSLSPRPRFDVGWTPSSVLTRRTDKGVRPTRDRTRRSRTGLTLLEVLLALAILGGAIAVVGELMRIGNRNAAKARDLTTAQILCETKVNEIVAGLIVPQTVTDIPVEDLEANGEWRYSILVQQIDQQGLISVTVTVQQDPNLFAAPESFSLVRWMIDPTMQVLSGAGTEGTSAATSSSTTGAASGT